MNKLILIFAVLCLFPQAYAQSCTDITKEIRNIKSEAFTEYPLLNDVKQDVLLIMYGRERGSCPQDIIEFSGLTKKFITDFDEAYRLANSDLSEDHLKAVELTRTLKSEADSLTALKGVFGVEGDDLVTSAQQVVNDFLILQADMYAREAETTKVSVRKIQFYKVASLAYESAGNALESSNNNIKADVLEEKYTEDMKQANAMHSKAEEEYGASKALKSGSIFSKVRAYVLGRSALINFEEAKVYCTYHHETEKITQIENTVEEVYILKQALLKELTIYFGGIAIFLSALAAFMLNRTNVWKRDSYDHLLGNELVQVSDSEK
jgi:hypothetical protein